MTPLSPPQAHEFGEEGRLKALGLAQPDVQPHNLALASGCHHGRYYGGDAGDTAALADLEAGRGDRQARLLAGSGA